MLRCELFGKHLTFQGCEAKRLVSPEGTDPMQQSLTKFIDWEIVLPLTGSCAGLMKR